MSYLVVDLSVGTLYRAVSNIFSLPLSNFHLQRQVNNLSLEDCYNTTKSNPWAGYWYSVLQTIPQA